MKTMYYHCLSFFVLCFSMVFKVLFVELFFLISINFVSPYFILYCFNRTVLSLTFHDVFLLGIWENCLKIDLVSSYQSTSSYSIKSFLSCLCCVSRCPILSSENYNNFIFSCLSFFSPISCFYLFLVLNCPLCS